jgi:putative FmdB family regulatory protein
VPIYEYRCMSCRRKSSLFFRSVATVEDNPACPQCGERGMQRLVSRFWAHRSQDTSGTFDDAWDDEAFGAGFGDDDLDAGDDEDPIAFARQTREMAAMFGEPLEPELDTALRRIESGADPEDVLGELEAAEAQTLDDAEATDSSLGESAGSSTGS